VLAHKGGCGKTTTAANLGAAFAERGHTALIIDTDPQVNLSEAFGIVRDLDGPRLEDAPEDPQTPATPWPLDHLDDPLFTRRGGRLDVLPCTARLEQIVTERAVEPGFPRRLRQITNELKPAYDVIVIDTQPGLGPLQLSSAVTRGRGRCSCFLDTLA
jgi:chromosome partitioning protein